MLNSKKMFKIKSFTTDEFSWVYQKTHDFSIKYIYLKIDEFFTLFKNLMPITCLKSDKNSRSFR